ncbi:Tad domain-containing protein [Agromyces sp. LHK192]|uniref:Tad domain-containing protein n=1 Tax=Agromyces sp. LHK192 TaxID=2498704 RepID=UPI0013E2C9C8|nr:Tad domain-containing protein [Agromyces sp. LHK192]
MRVARGVAREEAGSTLPLVIFLSVLSIVLIFVVVAATSLYLDRKRLFTLADGAALAGSEAWTIETITVVDDGLQFALDDETVRGAAAAYLAAAESGLDDVELVSASSDDGRSASVTLRTTWRVPIANELLPVEVPIEVTSTARTVFH